MTGRPLADDFDSLRGLGERLVAAGRLEEALAAFERALQTAADAGDARQAALAACNRAAVAIALDRGEAELPRQRAILMRDFDDVVSHLAAYNIARQHERAKSFKKSLFYARIALDRARLLGRQDWIAGSHNQIANVLLAESQVDEAIREYERAAAAMPATAGVPRAQLLGNLGYCRALQGRLREAFQLLSRSLRLLIRARAERFQISTRLDLCFAHLEAGRSRDARRHGLVALRLAERAGDADGIRNALYLLGEEASLRGDQAAAGDHFGRLQREFFPGAAQLPSFLMTVDVRKLINLHA